MSTTTKRRAGKKRVTEVSPQEIEGSISVWLLLAVVANIVILMLQVFPGLWLSVVALGDFSNWSRSGVIFVNVVAIFLLVGIKVWRDNTMSKTQ